MSEYQLKSVRVTYDLSTCPTITKIQCLSRLQEENLKQHQLIEEIEQVKHFILHDAAVSKPLDRAPIKKNEMRTIKRVPISKNSYSSKVKTLLLC